VPGVNIQFHMLPDEVLDFVDVVRARFALMVVLEKWFPDWTREVPPERDLRKSFHKFGPLDRMWLQYRPPRCRKSESFCLNMPKFRSNRLLQGQLGGGTEKPAAFKVLTQIAREFKKRAKAGAWVVTEAGNIGYCRDFRISPGATAASRAGEIELVSMGNTQSFHVDEPGST
jgi:hypothetical protein